MAVQRQDQDRSSPGGQGWERFGARVRVARENLGRSLDEVAEAAVVSSHMLAAIEAGEEAPGRRVVECLDRDFSACGVLLDAWARVFISARLADGMPVDRLEGDAAQVRIYDPFAVPEPFRTPEYAAALDRSASPMRRAPADDRGVRRLLRADHAPPYFRVVLDEAALHRPVGTPEITREQLRRLRSLIDKDHIALHVLPAAGPGHPCPRGGFRLLTFSPHHALAFNPHAFGPGQLITDADRVHGYTDLFSALLAEALPEHASAALLADAIGRETPRAITAGPPGDPLIATTSAADPAALARP
ncbi:Scr1 family TA system antitoxin-like transcriptional regulator [Nocardiopsis sediminis]|uniref:Scr1 family TA system antitoxin-like transcriptional regulator n=1 Tax=Nocardiopsis sediminis TaxID=1778267 RepID=A0ABV8FTU0_9ACTN